MSNRNQLYNTTTKMYQFWLYILKYTIILFLIDF